MSFRDYTVWRQRQEEEEKMSDPIKQQAREAWRKEPYTLAYPTIPRIYIAGYRAAWEDANAEEIEGEMWHAEVARLEADRQKLQRAYGIAERRLKVACDRSDRLEAERDEALEALRECVEELKRNTTRLLGRADVIANAERVLRTLEP